MEKLFVLIAFCRGNTAHPFILVCVPYLIYVFLILKSYMRNYTLILACIMMNMIHYVNTESKVIE